jgi:hypothetical protein
MKTNGTMIRNAKQSDYRSEQAPRFLGNWGSQISRQLTHEGGKVVSATHRPPLPQEIFLVLISVRGWVDPRIIVPEGLCQSKIPMTPSGIKLATFRLLARCLNQLLYGVPRWERHVSVTAKDRGSVYQSLIYIMIMRYQNWNPVQSTSDVVSGFRLIRIPFQVTVASFP